MRSNAEQFRENARACAESAQHAPDLNTRLFYLDLEQHWTYLAQEEERGKRCERFDQNFKGIECCPSQSRLK